MANFFNSLSDALLSTYCQFLDTMNGIWGPYARALWGEDSAIGAFLTGEYASRMLCNRPSDPPAPPFEGGQCEVQYDISYNATDQPNDDAPVNRSGVLRVWGPIYGFKYDVWPGYGNPKSGYWVRCHGLAPSTGRLPEPTWVNVTRTIFSPGRFQDLDAVVTDISRVDGLPDDCGTLPPAPDPEDNVPYTFDIDLTYQDNDGIDVTIPLVFAFGFAYLDTDFNLKIPVSINLNPNFNFNPTLNFNFNADIDVGNNTINYGPPRPPNTPPPGAPKPPKYQPPPSNLPPGADVEPPPPPPDIPDPDEDEDEDEPYPRVIVGAIVTMQNGSAVETASELGQNDNPNIRFPDVGLVSFQIRSRYGAGWTEDIRVKNDRQFIPCPWGGGAVSVKGTPRAPATMTVTPVYGAPEERFID